jgi:tripartite-type tricarboxylate transporter receptor subunit TctC
LHILAKARDVDAQPFYQGKTIRLVQGREPGGSGDTRVKMVAPYLKKYIPGSPTVISEYMPGAGGRKTANYLFSTARRTA